MADEENIICVICQFDLNDPEASNFGTPYTLPCSHVFHWECIKNWFYTFDEQDRYILVNDTCPLCRQAVNEHILRELLLC